MFKKSCFAICLLASAASASTDNWEGAFSRKNGLTICRKSNGDIFTRNEDGIDAGPYSTFSLPRTNQTNTKDDDNKIKLKSTFTPQDFLNALEQTGEVVDIQPPALSELLRPTEQPALTGMDRLNAMFLAKHGRLPTGEENAFMTEMLALTQAHVSDPTVVVETRYIDSNVTAITQKTIPGTADQAVRVIETHFVDEHTHQ